MQVQLKKQHSKYSKYKQTGIPWIGDVPDAWQMKSLKYLFSLSKEKSREANPTILSLTQRGIVIRDISTNEGQIAASYEGYNKINKGDIVLNPMDLISGFVDRSKYDGVISPAYSTLRNKKEANSQFYNYYFQKHYFEEILFPLGEGVSTDHRWTLKNEALLNLRIIEPSIDEQKSIAGYLDVKTVLIEQIIKAKKKQIGLLKEKRSALINSVVTRGLDEKIDMKKASFDWMDEVSENWQIIQIKRLLKSSDYGISDSLSGDGVIKVLTMGNIQNGEIIVPENGCLDKVDRTMLLKKDDILFNRTNSFDLVGKVGIFRGSADDQISFASYLVRFRSNKRILPEYLNYLLNSTNFVDYARSLALRSISQANLNPNRYGQIYVAIPDSIEEQKKIVDFIQTEIHKINSGIGKIERSISLLHEYKASLISLAVTGKIKVTNNS